MLGRIHGRQHAPPCSSGPPGGRGASPSARGVGAPRALGALHAAGRYLVHRLWLVRRDLRDDHAAVVDLQLVRPPAEWRGDPQVTLRTQHLCGEHAPCVSSAWRPMVELRPRTGAVPRLERRGCRRKVGSPSTHSPNRCGRCATRGTRPHRQRAPRPLDPSERQRCHPSRFPSSHHHNETIHDGVPGSAMTTPCQPCVLLSLPLSAWSA